MSNPLRVLDLFCKAGGATRGYQSAFGPDTVVCGVDIEPQPRYCGHEFIQLDVMEMLLHEQWRAWVRNWFDLVHASPPCQRYSDLARRNRNGGRHPDYIPELRTLLQQVGVPYVIENVEGAPLRNAVTLCGTMFPELRVLRHRLFEATFPVTTPPHKPHPLVFTHDKRKAHYGRLDQNTSYVQVTGGGNCRVANKRAAMGIDWMTGAELNEAIPPAYTEHVGACFAANFGGRL